MRVSRRQFARSAMAAGVGLAASPCASWALPVLQERPPRAPRLTLAERFPDLRRHFAFEYYPWYRNDPWYHWDEGLRRPPIDVGSNYMPRLGPYDSRSTAVMEQHAKWIAETGVGAISVSWWGPDTDDYKVFQTLMDVMKDHDIHVAFYIEPYVETHARNYARDVLQIVREFGDRRRWDCFLLLQHEDGKIGPVFKSFRTILPSTEKDCHGVTSAVWDYAADAVWREQTDRVREMLAGDFDRVTLLADSLDVGRTQAGGFDGIAIFDNYVSPGTWRLHADNCSNRNLVFSFNINPGFDGIALREFDPASCYRPPVFEPGATTYDWSRGADRDAAVRASQGRIEESFRATLALQTNPALANVRRGFFLTYINSFNEWHEGHQFEPMKDRAVLTGAERAIGYHNPDDGFYRLNTLRALIQEIL